jgi:peptidyl-prolyl cis-trans isomerase A (cyclophilin A)
LFHPSLISSEAFTTMRFTRFVAFAATLLVFSVISTFSQTSTTTPAKPKTSTTTTKPTPSTYDRTLLKPSLLKDTAPATYQVKFVTTRGEFTVTVTRAWAPNGADRFYNLVKHHYYDGARVYRVIPNFVAQFGISAYPVVNAAWANKATIKDDPVTQKNVRGTLTFAKTSQPNTRTTEIFINLKDNTGLDSQGFAPFAVVDDKGINIVEMFYDQYPDPAEGGEQPNMEKGGEQYIASKFPKLDTIKSATIVGGTSSTTSAKPAATATKPKP